MVDMRIPSNKLRLAYYESATEPRVMLFGPMEADVLAIQEMFRRLGGARNLSIQVDELEFVVPFGGVRLLATCSDSFAKSGLRAAAQGLNRASSIPPSFVWSRTAEGWDYLAELIEGVVRSVRPCHQYLSRFPGEDAIVVLSKGEYTDEVLTRSEERERRKGT